MARNCLWLSLPRNFHGTLFSHIITKKRLKFFSCLIHSYLRNLFTLQLKHNSLCALHFIKMRHISYRYSGKKKKKKTWQNYTFSAFSYSKTYASPDALLSNYTYNAYHCHLLLPALLEYSFGIAYCFSLSTCSPSPILLLFSIQTDFFKKEKKCKYYFDTFVFETSMVL